MWRASVAPAAEVLAAATRDLTTAVGHYASDDFNKATSAIMAVADRANAFIAEAAPWAMAKDPARRAEMANAARRFVHQERGLDAAARGMLRLAR